MYPYVTIQIVTIGAKVMAFEPLPSSAGLLRASLRFNDGGNHGGTTGTGSYWGPSGPPSVETLTQRNMWQGLCTDSNRCRQKVRIERVICEHYVNSVISL